MLDGTDQLILYGPLMIGHLVACLAVIVGLMGVVLHLDSLASTSVSDRALRRRFRRYDLWRSASAGNRPDEMPNAGPIRTH